MPNCRFTIAALVVFLTGCAAQQQQAAMQAGVSCIMAVYNSPEAAPYRAHAPANFQEASLVQLGDQSYASPADIASIQAIHPHFVACRNEFMSKLDQLAPALSPTFRRAASEYDDNALALTQRRLTWGEFVKRSRDQALARQEELLTEQRRLAAEDQARAQALNQSLATLAIINAANRPQVTFPPPPSPQVIVMPQR